MRFDELIGFFNNALLMLGLFVILELGHSLQRRNHRLRPWLSGFLISLVCLSVMSMSFEVLPGLRYDTRTILLSVTGLVFGPIPTAIVAVVAAAYHALQGGAAAFAAILSIFFSASCGLVWRALVVPRARQGRWIWFHVYAMGVAVHLGLLLFTLLVPDGVGQDVVRRIWLPVMLVYPAATLLLSHLLIRQRARIESGRLLDNPDSLHALFSDLPVVYQSLDAHGHLLDISPEWLALLGYTREEVAGHWIGEFMPVEEREKFPGRFERFRERGEVNGRISLLAKDASLRTFTVSGRVRRDAQGGFVRTFCVLHDISRYEASERDLVYAAEHDAMTGLYSKSYYTAASQALVTRGDFPASILIGDIDGLKQINDAHGYGRGDEIIRAAGRLRAETLGAAGTVARLGGAMFAGLFPRCAKREAGAHLLRVERALELHNAQLPEGALPVHLSLGYGTQTGPADSLEPAVREAETFMFQRKLFKDHSPQSALMKSILSTMNEKSFETEAHAERLVAISTRIGRGMGLDSLEIDKLHLLSLTHDIGKIIIPDPILNKPGRLTDEEWAVMRTHTEIGFRIAAASPGLSVIAEAILSHHERWDGTGYPRSLAGEAIPLSSRILAVADAFDAMITERPYRKPMPVRDALAEIERCAGSQFDPAVAEVFLGMAREGRLDDILQGYPQA